MQQHTITIWSIWGASDVAPERIRVRNSQILKQGRETDERFPIRLSLNKLKNGAIVPIDQTRIRVDEVEQAIRVTIALFDLID